MLILSTQAPEAKTCVTSPVIGSHSGDSTMGSPIKANLDQTLVLGPVLNINLYKPRHHNRVPVLIFSLSKRTAYQPKGNQTVSTDLCNINLWEMTLLPILMKEHFCPDNIPP